MSVTFMTDKDPIVRYYKQTLTEEQQAQARANIGAVSEKALGAVDMKIGEVEHDIDLTDQFQFFEGYLNKNGNPLAFAGAGCTDFISVVPGDAFVWTGQVDLNNSYAVAEYDANKKFIKGSVLASAGYVTTRNVQYEVTEGAYVRFSTLVASISVLIKTKHYDGITELKDKTDEYTATATPGLLNKNTGTVDEYAYAITTALIPVIPGEKFVVTACAQYASCCVAFYSVGARFISAGLNNADNSAYQAKNDVVIVPTGAAYVRFSTLFSGMTPLRVSKYEYVSLKQATYLLDKAVRIAQTGNVLYGKKYVSCGDSFTEGPFSAKNEETWDDTLGVYKTYPWHIATRNGMKLVNEAKSGSTMYNNGSTNAFSVTRYTKVPTDADYITLCFGLNEGSATIGTLEDTTNETVIGAWNTVLEYLITNLPYAKIGIIIPDAWLSAKLRDAIISVAKYWGIPYLDLKGDATVPMLIGGRSDDITVSATAVALRNAAFQVSDTDSHPNPKAHAYRSTIIENFMRSL